MGGGSPGPGGGRGRRHSAGLADPQDDARREPEPAADPESVARMICLRLLDLRPRTRSELAQALASRGVPDDAAEAVLTRFADVGLIDDTAFAAAWVATRHTGRGLASRALSQELRRKGVADETIAAAVGELDPEAERATARALVERRLRSTSELEPAARMRRLVGLLARKGYPPGLAAAVVREALGEENDLG